eukprot:scaffold84093_cov45-Attheya_sp.AAC.5
MITICAQKRSFKPARQFQVADAVRLVVSLFAFYSVVVAEEQRHSFAHHTPSVGSHKKNTFKRDREAVLERKLPYSL